MRAAAAVMRATAERYEALLARKDLTDLEVAELIREEAGVGVAALEALEREFDRDDADEA